MKLRIYLFLLLEILAVSILQAQEGMMFNFMRLNPLKAYDSPATELSHNGYVTIPALGDVNIGVYNSSIRYHKLFQIENGYPTTLTANTFANSLKDKNDLNSSVNLSIVSFGFRLQKTFLSFDYRIRMQEELRFSKDLIALPVFGNLAYLGADNPADLNFRLNLNAYQEFSVNIQHTFNEHFSLGIRPKYLCGLLNIRNAGLNAQLYTEEETYNMRLQYTAEALVSSIIPYNVDFANGEAAFALDLGDFNPKQVGQYFKNHGFGLDLGGIYHINDRFSLSFSILDLGFIHWKAKCTHLYSEPADNGQWYQDGAVVFSGLTQSDIDRLMQDQESRRQFLDSLSAYFPVSTAPTAGYTMSLATRGLLQFDFNLNKQNRFSALVQARFANKTCLPAVTLAYEGCFANRINVCAAYTLAPRNYANFGVALGFKFGIFNLYMATENVLPLLDQTMIARMNARLGIAFTFGKYD